MCSLKPLHVHESRATQSFGPLPHVKIQIDRNFLLLFLDTETKRPREANGGKEGKSKKSLKLPEAMADISLAGSGVRLAWRDPTSARPNHRYALADPAEEASAVPPRPRPRARPVTREQKQEPATSTVRNRQRAGSGRSTRVAWGDSGSSRGTRMQRPAADSARPASSRSRPRSTIASEKRSGKKAKALVGARGSAERKWVTEWRRLGQRQSMVESDIDSTLNRRVTHSDPTFRAFWTESLAQVARTGLARDQERAVITRQLTQASELAAAFGTQMLRVHQEQDLSEDAMARVRETMNATEDQFMAFKRSQKSVYEELMQAEEELEDQLRLVGLDWKSVVATGGAAASSSKQRASGAPLASSSSAKDAGSSADSKVQGINEQMRERMIEIDDEIRRNGGETGGWDARDHEAYIKLRAAHPTPSVLLNKCAKLIPFQDLYSVTEHHSWFERYETLCEEKRSLVADWKAAKQKAEAKAIERQAVLEAKRAKAERRREEARRAAAKEKAARVQAWKQAKVEAERKKYEEEKTKQEKAKARRARKFLTQAKRAKAATVRFKKEREEEMLRTQIESAREKRVVKRAEAVRRAQLRERVAARNRMDALKKEEKLGEKEKRKLAQQARARRLKAQSRPKIEAKSRLGSKTKAQKARENRIANQRRYGFADDLAIVQSRPVYMGVGRATPSWMK